MSFLRRPAKAQRENIKGLQQSADALTAIFNAVESEPIALKAMTKSAIRVRNRIVRSLHHSGKANNRAVRDKSGRFAKKNESKHNPSQPGEPPASDTGRLAQSYEWKVGRDRGGIFAEVGTNVFYAPYLEFGTRKMAPRPHVRPAIDADRVEIAKDIARMVEASQRAAAARQPKEIKL